MRAEFFYIIENVKSIPLYLMSPKQMEEQRSGFTPIECNYLSQSHFNGALGDCCLFYNVEGFLEKAFIGRGDEQDSLAIAHAALLLPPHIYQLQNCGAQEALSFWALAQYQFEKYRKSSEIPRILVIDPLIYSDLIHTVQTLFFVRDLINQPAGDMGPQEMTHIVQSLADEYQGKFEQWVGEELLDANFPAIYAVGCAAKSKPRLLSLTWGEKKNPLLSLVGKGVCFDTGGLNIKSAFSMRIMKKDMAGAAHAIGLAQWIMSRNLPVRLHLLIPAVENAIGPDAFRPGDVLRMRNGLSIEIDNTDAEGRLILADALVKACEEDPDLLIDFATLTSAARVSVGAEISAFFANNELLAEGIIDASYQTDDPVWRLPLFSPYEKYLRSGIADMTNCSDYPYGGAIIAALFLQRFICKTTPWVHFDIMAWNEQSKPGKPEGGEAMALRTVMEYLLRVYG